MNPADLSLPEGLWREHDYIRCHFGDEEPVRAAYWHPGDGETVMDVGSHHGSYTIPALAAGAYVIAVEPYREHQDVMLAIIAENGISTERLTIISEPLASTPGGYTEEFWQGLSTAPWPTIYATRSMPFTTMDELAARLGLDRLDRVKIDVEGAEFDVLQGAADTLERFRPFLLIEDHSEVYPWVGAMDSPRQCLELLRDVGYDPEIVRHEPGSRDYWVCRP